VDLLFILSRPSLPHLVARGQPMLIRLLSMMTLLYQASSLSALAIDSSRF